MGSVLGAVLTINCFRFKIVNADAAVYHYMQEHPDMFSPEAIDGVRENVIAASGAHLIDGVIYDLSISVRIYIVTRFHFSQTPVMTDNDNDCTIKKKVSFALD